MNHAPEGGVRGSVAPNGADSGYEVTSTRSLHSARSISGQPRANPFGGWLAVVDKLRLRAFWLNMLLANADIG